MDSTLITLTGNELGIHANTKELRHAAMRYAEQHLIGHEFTNADSGHTIKVTRQGMKHALYGGNAIELRLTVGLPAILECAKYQGAEPDRLGREHIKAAHKYHATVLVGGERLHIGIVTRERHNGYEHYDHFVIGAK